MRQRLHKTSIAMLLAGLAALSCLPNPEAPILEPTGVALLYDANFNSIQMNGDFSGVSWDATDSRNDLELVADFTWSITVSLLDGDLSDGSLEFKFTHDYSWAPDNFGAGSSLGQAELSAGPANIVLPVSLDQGFYTFTFDDETYLYSTEPEPATGALSGELAFAGDAPADGAEIALWAEHPGGNVELWSLEEVDGAFGFTGLADSLYTLRASAQGYASQTLSGIRVADGGAAAQEFLLEQVFGAISGTVSFEDVDTPPFPGALVVVLEHETQIEAGRDTSDVATGAYLVGGLGAGSYDLQFSAPGFASAGIDGIVITGEQESGGNDILLLSIPANSPDLPWATRVVDGNIDAGWPSNADDGGHVSNWGPANNLNSLHLAWDAERLYIGVDGTWENSNALDVYLDLDFGAGTGVSNMANIAGLGSIGDVQLKKNINTDEIPGFGAEVGVTIKGNGTDGGVCDLAIPGAITLIADTELARAPGAMEFSIPWLKLYPDLGGLVPEDATLALFCVISGGTPEWFADDFLPPLGVDLPVQPQTNYTLPAAAIFSIQVDADGE